MLRLKVTRTSWTTNECGEGHYCKFTPTSAVADPTSGVCLPLPDERKTYVASDGYEYFMVRDQTSAYYYDWWSGQSLCASQGKEMVHVADVHCSTSGGYYGSCSDDLLYELGDNLYRRGTWTADPYNSSGYYYMIDPARSDGRPIWHDVPRTERRSILCRSKQPVNE